MGRGVPVVRTLNVTMSLLSVALCLPHPSAPNFTARLLDQGAPLLATRWLSLEANPGSSSWAAPVSGRS